MKNLFRLFIFVGAFSLGTAGMLLATLSGLFLYQGPKLPSVEFIKDQKLQVPLRVFTSDGKMIGEFGEKRRSPITFNEIPRPFLHAILAAEDDRFFSHHGVDPTGLGRAIVELAQKGKIHTGGSTITMQVARNFFLNQEKTFSRKFNEILLAIQLERTLSKPEIIELYVNKIFLGNRAYGVEAAAQIYYGKHLSELTLAEQAMIAGLPKAPSKFNPIVNPDRAMLRRNWIIRRMLELGFIDQAAYDDALSQPNTAQEHGTQVEMDAAYVAEMARKFTVDQFGEESAYIDGYNVYTTISSKLQLAANAAVRHGVDAYEIRHGYRGAEGHVKAQAGDDAAQQDARWASALARILPAGDLLPVIISKVSKDGITTRDKNHQEREILWQGNLEKLRIFSNIDYVKSAGKSPGDIFHVGDIIRIRENDKHEWHVANLPFVQGALVSLNPQDGAVLALVGGYDFQQSHFNRIEQAKRQPGSSFKPFIYTIGLENGYTAASIVNDAPLVIDLPGMEEPWRPQNSSGDFLGPMRLRKGLYMSRNLISIRILKSMNIHKTVKDLGRFGFDADKLPHNLSLALGSHAVPPLQIAGAYATFANGGYRVDPYIVSRIENSARKVVYQADPATVCENCIAPPVSSAVADDASVAQGSVAATETSAVAAAPQSTYKIAQRIIDPRIIYIMDSILKDVVLKGTGMPALVLNRRDIAGKTGTTNGPTDVWFSGYTPDVVTTAWVGFDKYLPLGKTEFGGTAALPIWIEYMRTALADHPEKILPQPEGLVTVKIDPESGKLAAPGQENAIFEMFTQETVPTESAPAVLIDDAGGAQGIDAAKPVPTEEIF